MARDADLLLGLLAEHLGLVSGPQVLEAARSGAPVAAALEGSGVLSAAEVEALRRIATSLVAASGGDEARALAAAPVDAKLRLRLGGDTGGRTEVRQASPADESVEGIVVPEDEERYRLGRELGRGGLGRVVEALDTRLDREVAVKLVLSDLPADLRRRFEREARITARLEHPNVVPVHDFGELPADGGQRELFLCMKRVRGRDFGQVLRSLVKGGETQRAEWSRVRLLGVFQGICLGVAYAHSKGILHRDLKPSNVMIGDFGEVLVVDWGLAREMQATDAAVEPHAATGDAVAGETEGALTLAGDILGTPSYMSPEQASAPAWQLDARSDIFALGAILYEILTLRPPYVGASLDELITSVKSGSFPAPSATVLPPGWGVPEELEAITMKAMAFRREERFASAMELHREIQLYLEGVRERERAQREATARAAAGTAELARHEELKQAIAAQAAAVAELRERTPGHLAAEQKRPLWAAEEKLKDLEEQRIAALTRAASLFEQALMADRSCREAEDGRCGMELQAILEAEAVRDATALSLHMHRLETIDAGGRWRARLNAPGTLVLRAFAWECDCAAPAPGFRADVEGDRLVPWLDGAPVPGAEPGRHETAVPALKTLGAFGHRAGCRKRELSGLRVRAGRYAERARRLVVEAERSLGTTPVRVELPQGSWRVEVEVPSGFHGPLVAPVRIGRSEEWVQDLTLYPAAQVPEGFLLVPGGPFIYGGRWAGGQEARRPRTRDLFVSRFAVTCEQYIDFLNDAMVHGSEADLHRVSPRTVDGSYFPRDPGPPPRFRMPHPGPETRGIPGFGPGVPVFSLTWFGAAEYAAWRSAKEGRLYTLLHEEEFEKAARGVDGRVFPWGDLDDLSFHHTDESFEGGSRMAPVGTFTADESPYGIRDLSGSICSWLWNAPPLPHRDHRALRGGSWEFSRDFCRPAYALATRLEHVSRRYGARIAYRPLAWDGGAE